jgi:16S rRNA (guanine1516-N2)-methyltransferase
MLTIGVYTEFPELTPRAEELSRELDYPLLPGKTSLTDYILLVTPDYIGLKKTGSKATPLYVDFLSKKMTYRRQHASVRREKLARALGLKNKTTPKIVDATAGLGRDSFILASLGFEVTMLERSPLIYILLKDGIERASRHQDTAAIMQRMHLATANAIDWLHHNTEQPDIIYLDPMYPERRKSALGKKEMRLFQEIIGADEDAAHLLTAALACASNRVVVKRARLAENLGGLLPDFSQEGSSSRFDVYLKQAQ